MFTTLLKEKNISVTKQRLHILTTLQHLSKPVTIETIRASLHTPIDTATLYRSLSVLVQSGIVYQTDFREGVAYYELQGENHHHHHLVCTECKTKQGFDYCPALPIHDIQDKTGFSITNHIFELFGLCKKCTK